MSWKKNVCSYLLWLIYAIAVSVGVIGIFGAGFGSLEFPEEYCFPVAGVYSLVAGLLVLFLHKQAVKRKCSESETGMVWLIVEGILLVALLAVGIALRAGQMQYVSGTEADMVYFEAAKVAEGNGIPQVVHGATYIYLELLHLVFLLFGNKLLAAVWLQVVMQCLAGIFLYFAVRRLAGKVPALVMLGFLMLSPYTQSEAMSLSPEGLYLVIFSLVLWIIACILKKNNYRIPFLYIFEGILIGVCFYFDISGTLLLVFAAGIFTVERDKPVNLWNKRGIVFLLNIIGTILGWFAAILLDALVCGKEILGVMTAWLQLYQPAEFKIPTEAYTVQNSSYVMLINAIVLYAFLVFGVFSFWCRRKQERQGIWIAMAIALMALQCFQILTPELMGVTYLYLCFAVLAGIGVADIYAVSPKAQPVEFLDEDLEPGAYFKCEEPVENVETAEKVEIVEKVEAEEKVETAEKLDTAEKVEPTVEPPKVRFLENPLPLPKKHEAKVMDYRITDVADADFDFEVADDDDFDI